MICDVNSFAISYVVIKNFFPFNKKKKDKKQSSLQASF